ncbi:MULTISPECIES: transcription termination/antitermination protein NusG [unclassified Bradyrhizobium]|uniref:transcription termination/antitermination protein NusG n=1 Tax=unclassified Bradyrhizobium TaxID=2631580 RepID=UPI001FEED988|nr:MULTISPECIES: transcription termination/antitermination NusG family protein [unclassified Bradyrhizobium]
MAHLARQGFDVYFPRYLKRRSHAGKVDMVAAALFSRYVFVSIDLTKQQWRVIRSTVGVAQLVCHGDRPAPLADGIVAELRSREDDRGLIQLNRSAFRPGEKVRVVGGAFADHLGMFEAMGDSERVAVLLDLLGRKVRAVMNINVIEAA